MFKAHLFNPARICAELYNPTRRGGLSLSGFLQPAAREQLLCEIQKHVRWFRPASRDYLNAVQEFDFFHLGEQDDDRITGNFETILRLRARYARLYKMMAEQARFHSPGALNSITVQRYPQDSLGITSHRDESQSINLISIFVLAGEAPFGISTDRQKSDVVELPASPGDLILLRAPRDRHEPTERKMRPLHYVGRVVRERYSLTFREKM